MKIKSMFKMDIERPISGVIKVGQDEEENILQELEEYVVTKEINKHLGKFYENYLKSIDGSTDKIGVWISGFFGSGKSHFLKILSYLLENKTVEGKEAIDFFNDKIEDEVLLGDIKRAGKTDTEVILFNIDAKSPMAGKADNETLLKIFLKMFHNHQGFYGDNPGIAYMEKYLTSEGKYDLFKEEFRKVSGHEWIERRRTFHFIRDHVVTALSNATGMSEESAREWHKTGVKEYQIDIEGFAKEVKEYLDIRGKDSRLIFLVDEVGQYIGEDNTLMLNLQTIAEEFGSKCHGKAWIMVTSQEAIDELSKRIREDDFSKIQGRFDTKLSLSSISVDEVIKKRILEKEDHVNERLEQIYFEKSAILKNLVHFKDSRDDLRCYVDEKEFAMVYPFIPYQFKLLQSVFEQIRKRGSSGKHLSEGERSMLSAFKESAIKYKDNEEGVLIPFYAFYETIYEFLNPSITRVIDGAYNNPALKDDEFTISLLKVLFMIKYIDELPANVDNLAVLMISHIDEDKILLKEKIIKSLSILSRQILIQKNGEVYIFLTDDEQDVNRDIKLTHVDEGLIKRELRTYIFDQFYENKRYRYSNNYDFDFNKKMDEVDHGRLTGNIGINVLSPLSDSYNVPDVNLMMQTKDTGELIIRLDDNKNYLEELEEVLRVIEYTKKINMNEIPENKQLIINGKKSEERTKRNRVRDNLEDALKNASFYVNGEKIVVSGTTVKDKINNAMKILTDSIYTKLSYIKVFRTSNDELQDILNTDFQQINMDESLIEKNELAIKEIYDYINLEEAMRKQIRVKPLLDNFKEKPFGWNELDIIGIVLTLLKDQKINLRYQGSQLTTLTPNIVQILTKSSEQDKIVVSLRDEIDKELLNDIKNIAKELWNTTNIPEDEDGIAKEIRTLIDKQIIEINNYLDRYEGRKYPGKSLLEKGIEYFEELENVIDNTKLFKQLKEMEDNLIIWDEDMGYVKGFFNNQKDIFDNGLRVYRLYKENSDYLNDTTIREAYDQLSKVLEDHVPYGKIKDIPGYINIIDKGIFEILEDKKLESMKQVEQNFDYLKVLANHEGVKESTKDGFVKTYNGLKNNIETNTEILKIEGIKARSLSFRTSFEQQILQEINAYKPPVDPKDQLVPPTRVTKKIKLNDLTNIKNIKSHQDVDVFLSELGKILRQELRTNNIELID